MDAAPWAVVVSVRSGNSNVWVSRMPTSELCNDRLADGLGRSRHDTDETVLVIMSTSIPRPLRSVPTSFPSERYGLKSSVESIVLQFP